MPLVRTTLSAASAWKHNPADNTHNQRNEQTMAASPDRHYDAQAGGLLHNPLPEQRP
jgi:hypothetical protein